jgi:hypothetical protein
VWAVLHNPEEWLHSEMEGSFVTDCVQYPVTEQHDGPSSYAERIWHSERWGEVYDLGFLCIPGGAHANQGLEGVLAWRTPDNGWKVLWKGGGNGSWHMGWYNTSDLQSFSILEDAADVDSDFPFRIAVHLKHDEYPSSHGGGEEENVLEPALDRDGILSGRLPRIIEWTTPWRWTVQKGESWAMIARSLNVYRGDGSTAADAQWLRALERANQTFASLPLTPGTKIIVPERPGR